MSDGMPPPLAVGAVRSNEVQFGPWLSEAFQRFGDRAGLWIGQGVIATVISSIPALAGLAVFFPTYIATLEKLQKIQSPEEQLRVMGEMMGSYGALFVGSLIQAFLIYYFLGGMVRTAARQLRGQPTSVMDVFSGGGNPVAIGVQAFILTLVQLFCGFLTCQIGTGVFMGLWIFAIPLVTERGEGALGSLASSWRTVSDQWLHYVLWALLLGLFLVIGQSMCWVGTIVVLPIIALAIALGYRDVIGLDGAEPRSKPEPPPLPTGME